MSFKPQIVATLEAYFKSNRDKHLANAEIMMSGAVGVAEHPDVISTIEGELGLAAEYQDKLEMLGQMKDHVPRI